MLELFQNAALIIIGTAAVATALKLARDAGIARSKRIAEDERFWGGFKTSNASRPIEKKPDGPRVVITRPKPL
jgi:hypothetical protein